jgi:hypothetical protein
MTGCCARLRAENVTSVEEEAIWNRPRTGSLVPVDAWALLLKTILWMGLEHHGRWLTMSLHDPAYLNNCSLIVGGVPRTVGYYNGTTIHVTFIESNNASITFLHKISRGPDVYRA